MKTFNIYKKRDGQDFNLVSDIYSDTFENAKKQFAKQMTDEYHTLSNDIIWLSKENGAHKDGWYDFNGGSADFNEDTEKYDADDLENFLLVSQEEIEEGFDTWSEDVYTWKIVDFVDYEEINDFSEFEDLQDDYEFFMCYYGHRFFLYNGDFQGVCDIENFGNYSDTDSDFVGCSSDDIDTVKLYLNE